MTTLEPDDRFNMALADCCRRLKAGENLENCLIDHPIEYRDELARLAPLAGRLSQLGRNPSTEFQAQLEQRLRTAVGEMQPAQKPGVIGHIGRFFATFASFRLAVAALGVLMLLAGGVGVIQAADDSLPDSPLYNVKTVREWAEMQLARNEETRMVLQTRQMNQRARELERAMKANKPRRIIEPLALGLAASTAREVDLALMLNRQGHPESVNQTQDTIRTARRYLDRLSGEVSPNYRPVIERLRNFLDQQEQRLSRQGASAGRSA